MVPAAQLPDAPSGTAATSNAVDRALNILELVVQRSDGLTNSEISRKLSIPKSSASYLLRTLEQRGYVRRDPTTHRYRIGLKAASLAHGMMEFVDLRQAASPVLHQLVERTRLTAHLAILDHGRAVYIDRAENPGFLRINTWVGRDLDVHTTAVGKILLAQKPEEEIRRILAQEGMAASTPKTITSPEAYLQELEKVRSQGYAEDNEENNTTLRTFMVESAAGECLPCTSGQPNNAVGASYCTAPADPLLPPWQGHLYTCLGVRANGTSCESSGIHPNGWSYTGPRCPDPATLYEGAYHRDLCGNPGVCPGTMPLPF